MPTTKEPKLTKRDVEKMLRIAELKAELDKLSTEIKAKCAEIREYHGNDLQLDVAGHTITITKVDQQSVSWKAIATALVAQDAIDAVKDEFTIHNAYVKYAID